MSAQLTPKQQTVLAALRSKTEGCKSTDKDGSEWEGVYLDNAIPDGMSRRAFAGVLSSLQQKGFYRPQGDDCFGDVLIKSAAITDRPCAAPGLLSYRYKGRYGWIMIGAENDADAMTQAARSSETIVTLRKLQFWNGTEYQQVKS